MSRFDKGTVASIMEKLRSGRSVQQHNCKSRRRMELHYYDDQVLQMSFVPGHHFLHYKFGVSGVSYAVSRSRFMSALEAAGVDVQRVPTS